MAYITEKNLSDSELFKSFNSASKLSSTLVEAVKNGIEITEDYIQEQIHQIRRSRISPLSDKVLSAYENGNIIILYARGVKIPQAVPFFALKTKSGETKVFIFANNFSTMSLNDNESDKKYLNITMKDLYALMEGAYITWQYNTNYKSFNRALGLMKLTTKIYSRLMLLILNKEFALSMDTSLYAEVNFIISYFFMKHVWDSDNESINISYALDSLNPSDKYSLSNSKSFEAIVEEMDNSNVNDISKLINFISSRSNRLKGLNFRYFTQTYINTYKGPAIFSMESLPYFLFTVSTTALGSFIVNNAVISNIINNQIKGMGNYYPEISKLVS